MTDHELKQRVKRLEEEIFGKDSKTSDVKKDEKIGYLQNKLRDTGENIQEIESSIGSLESEIDRLKSEEDLKEEMEKEVRELRKKRDEVLEEFECREKELIETVDKKIEQVEDIENNVERLIGDVEDRLDEYDDVTDEFLYQVIETANFTSQFTINSFKMSQNLSEVLLKKYLPESDLSSDYWERLFNQHEVSLNKANYLNESIQGWIEIVEEIRKNDTDYFDPVEDERLFEAYLMNMKMLIDIEYHGIEEKEAHGKWFGKSDPESLEEVFNELGLEVDKASKRGQFTDVTDQYYHAELYAMAVSENVDSSSGARAFIEEFEDSEDPRNIVEHLGLAGLDETVIDSIDEEKLKKFMDDVKAEGIKDIEESNSE